MTKVILLAGLCLALPAMMLPVAARAEGPDDCRMSHCLTQYRLVSTSDRQGYGLLIAAPESGCRRVRFRVEDQGAVLGKTPALDPGELAVVRMTRRFAEGDHLLSIAAEGCSAKPAATRRVTLAKLSPDHGWRAAEAMTQVARLR